MERILRTTCTRDCPDACSLLVRVDARGRLLGLRGDPEHPVTRGFLCERTNRFRERQEDPDRLLQPLVRRGGRQIPCSWEEALDFAASRLAAIREESGGASILHYRSGGSLGLLKHATEAFFRWFGPVTEKHGDICSGAGEAAQEADFGISESHDLFDLRNSRLILLWGANPAVSRVHLVPVLLEARRRGARVIGIDPVRHRSERFCDRFLQPRPGGDFALALALIRHLFEEGGADPASLERCTGVEALRELAASRSHEAWCAEADLPPAEVRSLAEEVAATKPMAILVGWGLQRRTNGGGTVRALDALGAVSGNLGVPGGGVSFYFGRRTAFDLSFLDEAPPPPRTLSEPLLSREIPAAQDPPIRCVWVTAGNPVAMLPDSEGVRRALEAVEFTVVVDSHPTDTTCCADLVLPCTTMLEDEDLCGAYGHHWLGEVRRVLEPPPGVRTDLEIVRELAARLPLPEAARALFEEDAGAWKQRLLARLEREHGVGLAKLRAGPLRRPDRPAVLFADGPFPTPDGKAHLLEREPPPVPRPSPERPLYLMALATSRTQASQDRSERQQGPVEAVLHPEAAAGLPDGARAVLESARGRLEVILRHDSRQRRDVVVVPKGGWLRRGRCANALIPARETDLGSGAAYYDETVRVLPV